MQYKNYLRRFLPGILFISFAAFLRFFLKDEKIRIKKAYPTSGYLELKNWAGGSANKFKIKAGKTLTWQIKTDRILRITAIRPKQGPSIIYSVLPHSVLGSLNWVGTISDSAAGKEEEYAIDWIDKATNQAHTFDPKIQVM
ncbi:MAG: hypothetical protein ABIR81_00375 [Ginsengibacter sp.]